MWFYHDSFFIIINVGGYLYISPIFSDGVWKIFLYFVELFLFQQPPVYVATFQNTHLVDGDLIEFLQSFRLWHSLFYKDSIEILHIGKTYQLIYWSVITDIPFKFRIGIAPLLGGHAKHRYIQNVGFIGIDDAGLSLRNLSWNKLVLYSVCVDTVVDFWQLSFGF